MCVLCSFVSRSKSVDVYIVYICNSFVSRSKSVDVYIVYICIVWFCK